MVEDFAAELVAEDDRLVRAHEVGVAGVGHHLGDFVAVVAGVQVGAGVGVGWSTTSSFAWVQVTAFMGPSVAIRVHRQAE